MTKSKSKIVGSKKRGSSKSAKLHQKSHATTKKRKSKQKKALKNPNDDNNSNLKLEKPTNAVVTPQFVSPLLHRNYFIEQFESANGTKLSSIELESIKDSYFVKLSEDISQETDNLGQHVKDMFGSSWKEVLCEPQLIEGKVDPGNPSVLVISASAIRSLEMLRGLRILTKECQAVKLFSKHLKIDDQVALLKNRVNIASGTPNRIKKLFEMEALGLSRLEVILLDMQADVKGFSLLSLKQVRDEFWDLYKSYFHQRLLQGSLRICLYGPIKNETGRSVKKNDDQ